MATAETIAATASVMSSWSTGSFHISHLYVWYLQLAKAEVVPGPRTALIHGGKSNAQSAFLKLGGCRTVFGCSGRSARRHCRRADIIRSDASRTQADIGTAAARKGLHADRIHVR